MKNKKCPRTLTRDSWKDWKERSGVAKDVTTDASVQKRLQTTRIKSAQFARKRLKTILKPRSLLVVTRFTQNVVFRTGFLSSMNPWHGCAAIRAHRCHWLSISTNSWLNTKLESRVQTAARLRRLHTDLQKRQPLKRSPGLFQTRMEQTWFFPSPPKTR